MLVAYGGIRADHLWETRTWVEEYERPFLADLWDYEGSMVQRLLPSAQVDGRANRLADGHRGRGGDRAPVVMPINQRADAPSRHAMALHGCRAAGVDQLRAPQAQSARHRHRQRPPPEPFHTLSWRTRYPGTSKNRRCYWQKGGPCWTLPVSVALALMEK